MTEPIKLEAAVFSHPYYRNNHDNIFHDYTHILTVYVRGPSNEGKESSRIRLLFSDRGAPLKVLNDGEYKEACEAIVHTQSEKIA